MPIFCPITSQLLVPVIVNGEMVFTSTITKASYPAEPADTLRFTEDLKKSNTSISIRQLQNLIDDNVNPRKIGICPACKKMTIIASIQNGNDLETINGCTECGHQYPEV